MSIIEKAKKHLKQFDNNLKSGYESTKSMKMNQPTFGDQSDQPDLWREHAEILMFTVKGLFYGCYFLIVGIVVWGWIDSVVLGDMTTSAYLDKCIYTALHFKETPLYKNLSEIWVRVTG